MQNTVLSFFSVFLIEPQTHGAIFKHEVDCQGETGDNKGIYGTISMYVCRHNGNGEGNSGVK